MLFVSCAGGAGGGSSESTATSLCVRMPTTRATYTYAVSDVEIFTVSISSSSYSSTKSCGQGESLTFANIPVGHYSVTAYGKTASGNIAAKGTTSVDVEANITKQVSIKLSRLEYYAATDATSFSGTVEQFLATEFANTSSATSPYPITITGVTNANLASIVNHLSEFSVLGDDGYYSKELYSNLTLSGDGLTEIPASMFSTSTGKYSNGKIMAINLPDSVTKIGNSAFYGMSKLASITLPSNLEEIGQSAFAYMGSSSGVGVAITLPASVKKIYVNAFSSSNLTSLTVEGTNDDWVRRNSSGDAMSFLLSLDVTSFSSDAAGEFYDRY